MDVDILHMDVKGIEFGKNGKWKMEERWRCK